jgi:hypothetical protein
MQNSEVRHVACVVTVFPSLFEIDSKEDVQEKAEEIWEMAVELESILSGCGNE